MRFSIVMAAHNEGDLLWKTVQSCVETCAGLDYEIVVADDCSTDSCITDLQERFPQVTVHRTAAQGGPSPTKDLAARRSTGEVLVFFDPHCKPEPGAVDQLVTAVERSRGRAVVVPVVAVLDVPTWTNKVDEEGFGYQVDLADITWQWLDPKTLGRTSGFVETPSLIGCCLALTRRLYEKLGGFDPDMRQWGVEDVELGVKSWMLGHPVWCERRSIVGHRFQHGFTTYRVLNEHVVANRLRMACKIFDAAVWPVWLEQFRAQHDAKLWKAAWGIFCERRASAERERAYLQQHRVHDEFSYAARFGLRWPHRRLKPRTEPPGAAMK